MLRKKVYERRDIFYVRRDIFYVASPFSHPPPRRKQMLRKMKFNLFVKPNEQRQSREDLSDAMARKGRMKSNLFVKPNEQRQSREDLSDAMAR